MAETHPLQQRLKRSFANEETGFHNLRRVDQLRLRSLRRSKRSVHELRSPLQLLARRRISLETPRDDRAHDATISSSPQSLPLRARERAQPCVVDKQVDA